MIFQHQSIYYPKEMVWNITRNPKKFKCLACFSSNVRIIHYGYRDIRGMPMGARTLTLRVKMHRIKCRDCDNCQVETLPFHAFSLNVILPSMSLIMHWN